MNIMNSYSDRTSVSLAVVLLLASSVLPMRAADLGPSLTKAETPARAVSSEGFIQRWLILEPIRANGLTDNVVRTTVSKEHFPNQLSIIPSPGENVRADGTNLTWHAVDTTNYNVNLFHLARAVNRPTSDVLFWAVSIVESSEEISEVRLAIGSNAASLWWVNGQEVIGIYGDRQTVVDDGVSKRLTLKKGPNVIRCAVINGGGATDFCARFLDGNDRPLTNLTVRLNAAR
jgi:hypothetical protein